MEFRLFLREPWRWGSGIGGICGTRFWSLLLMLIRSSEGKWMFFILAVWALLIYVVVGTKRNKIICVEGGSATTGKARKIR